MKIRARRGSHIRVRQLRAGELDVRIYDDLAELARAAATDAVAALGTAIDARGEANVLLATGNSQLAFLAELVTRRDVDWTAVTAFHMDEYAGLPPGHAASFQRYMRERVAAHLPLRAIPLPRRHQRSRGRSAAVRRPARRAPTRSLLRGYRRERPSRVQRPTGRRLRRSRDRQGDRPRGRVPASTGGGGPLRHDRRRPDPCDHGHDPGAARRPARARDRPRVTKGEAGTGHPRGADLDRVPGHVPPDPVARLALPGSRSRRAHRRPLP